MTKTKDILIENRETVNKLLQTPGVDRAEKLQYKLMDKNLKGMLKVVLWIDGVKQRNKAR